ncbi:MlaC/ttg2D family ABC transporter substrate-binding protein [Desulfatiferula olefinivorans]
MAVAFPAGADDGAEVDRLIKSTMDKAMAIAKNPDISDAKKRDEIWAMVPDIFDFEKITEFTLGPFAHDSKANLGDYADRRFTKAQQDEFRDVFTRHLGNNYLDRVDFNNVDVAIELKPAEILETKKGIKRAQVPSIVNGKTPIDYMFLNAGKGWKVYDVKVEGRSLVSAFRTEYKTILINNTPDALINMLKQKIADHEAAKNAKS